METVDNRTWKEKIHDTKVKACEKLSDGWNGVKKTVSDHPMESFTLACLAVPGVLKIINSTIRAHSQNQETRYNECDIYDPRTGTHYYTRRPLSNKEKLNLESAYKEGRSKGDYLREKHLI